MQKINILLFSFVVFLLSATSLSAGNCWCVTKAGQKVYKGDFTGFWMCQKYCKDNGYDHCYYEN